MNLAINIDDIITCRNKVKQSQDLLTEAFQLYPYPHMRIMDQLEKSMELIGILDRRIAELKKVNQ
jgi:hypothetical protein